MGSPSGEKMLGGWNDRTDLHLSLQLTLTTPIAYRNDQWCRVVWGSQQVHSAFFFPFPLRSPPPSPPQLLTPFHLFLMARHETQRNHPDTRPLSHPVSRQDKYHSRPRGAPSQHLLGCMGCAASTATTLQPPAFHR